MRLNERLSRLERVGGYGTVCPDCGRIASGPRKGRIPEGVQPTIRVTFGEEPDDTPDFCPTCGAKLVFRIEFDRDG